MGNKIRCEIRPSFVPGITHHRDLARARLALTYRRLLAERALESAFVEVAFSVSVVAVTPS
jgi:hypothetical protein